MGTELPTDRLHRRHGAEVDADAGADDDGASDAALSRWLPDTNTQASQGWLAAVRADPGRAGAIALGVVGVVAVLVTVFTLLADKTPPVVSAKLPPVEMVSSAQPSPSAPAPDGPVIVSVVGLVHKPGLVTLSSGARIADALTAAGGALDGADLIGLNMARRVADGEQIIVGIAAPPGEPTTMGSSVASEPAAASASGAPTTTEAASAPGTSVDLNTATEEQLDALPGVGPVTAAAIVAWRAANGSFTSVDQLADVDGIGPARLEKLRAQVHV
ncbi:ComEA family DNA-binding protein [Mycobacterium sp. ITM-2016-00318]|uniref:ComEA family DNA-binding protein n=1 Tax=Mycobacterium sp. ITM-2016-00318 TaxID=2099693 RepID=UPI000CF870B0|nr:ComEA family DNA-binding protein [Mycobacterium sp. ITM-2016-00318]WNG91218.1 ComEA family DNA-binding protein [Mycobacterium sp. ITM-2016-00318]